MYVLGWYVPLKGSVAFCRSPLRICMHSDILLLYFIFGSKLFLKFTFLYVHLVLTTVSFFSTCIHQILFLHSHNDRHLHSLQHPASKTILEQTILYKSIYQSVILNFWNILYIYIYIHTYTVLTPVVFLAGHTILDFMLSPTASCACKVLASPNSLFYWSPG